MGLLLLRTSQLVMDSEVRHGKALHRANDLSSGKYFVEALLFVTIYSMLT